MQIYGMIFLTPKTLCIKRGKINKNGITEVSFQ